MTVNIRVTTYRKEYDTVTYTLSAEQYQKFLELRKSEDTATLGEFVRNNNIGRNHFDCWGEGDSVVAYLHDEFEDEHIED